MLKIHQTVAYSYPPAYWIIKIQTMKAYLIIPLIALVAILSGCKKSNNDPTIIVDPPFYAIQALKNNVPWTGNPKANFGAGTGADSVYIQGSGMWDVLLMKFRFTGNPGKYNLTADQWNYYWTFGEVIIRAKYYLRTDVPSSVTVTAYNPANKVMEGTFDLHLYKLSGTVATDLQNIDFTGGRFYVQLTP
jgi:hypothetical protein